MQRQRKMTSKKCFEWGLHKLVSKDNNVDFAHLLAGQLKISVLFPLFFCRISLVFSSTSLKASLGDSYEQTYRRV